MNRKQILYIMQNILKAQDAYVIMAVYNECSVVEETNCHMATDNTC